MQCRKRFYDEINIRLRKNRMIRSISGLEKIGRKEYGKYVAADPEAGF